MGSVGSLKNSTMVCAPLMAPSVEQLVHGMLEAKAQGADLVEIRLDAIHNFQPQKDLQVLLKNKPLPVIILYRPIWEGNQFEDDTRKQLEVVRWAKELGADYVELDFKVASDFRRKEQSRWSSDCKVITSCFLDNVTSKEDLTQVVVCMQSTGADILKIVTNANDITELEKTFHLLSHCQVPLIAYSVGERGLISQLLGPKFGSFLLYGSLDGNAVPGMPSLGSLRQAYRVDFMDNDTKVFGLISKPVGHSKGPILHNPTFRHVGYNGIYVPMFVDDLKEFFRVYSSPDFSGFRPCDGKLIGYNTDCEASITAIEDALKVNRCTNGAAFLPSSLARKLFVLVGAGGAGRALAFGAKSRGARILIFDIDFDRAKALAAAVSGEALPYENLASFRPEKGAILANATPVGMHPNKDRIPVPEATLKDYVVVFDAVYTPRKTTLLEDAEAAGAITVSGVEMFLRQAIGQFNLFTGSKAPEEFMREIVMAKF
ncbi:unnamed protein product [Withania somnifera]